MENLSWFKDEKAKEDFKKIIGDVDLEKNQEDSLEEDYRIRDIIGKAEDEAAAKKLRKMNSKAILLQDIQNDFLDDLDQELNEKKKEKLDVEYFLKNFELFTKKLKFLEDKIRNIRKDTAEDFGDVNVLIKSQDLIKEYSYLTQQVERMAADMVHHDINEENLLKLQKEFNELKEKYLSLEKIWFPNNPLNN
jgi:hypothetical protein